MLIACGPETLIIPIAPPGAVDGAHIVDTVVYVYDIVNDNMTLEERGWNYLSSS